MVEKLNGTQPFGSINSGDCMYFSASVQASEDAESFTKKIAEYLTMHPEVYSLPVRSRYPEIPVWAVIRLAELYVSHGLSARPDGRKERPCVKRRCSAGRCPLPCSYPFISCRRAFCFRRRASARFFPRFRCCFLAERAGPARISRCSARRSDFSPFFVQEHFLAAPSDARRGKACDLHYARDGTTDI